MGAQPLFESTVVKVEPVAPAIEGMPTEGIAISLDHSSTTMSDGDSPQPPEMRSNYVSHIKDVILQKRNQPAKVEPIDCTSPEPGPELDDAESPTGGVEWMKSVHARTAHNPVQMGPAVIDPVSNPASFFNWSSTNRPQDPNLDAEVPSNAQRTACRQFWKAGDYEGVPGTASLHSNGIDHVRVHPKFLHSNATSHKWVLGAVAELLDNAMDEVRNGATFVNVDMIHHPIDRSPMLYIEDNGGGMTPERMRECMSLGFSTKSKSGNTIGQYGNGFKTSTMRLGADVIVFSRSPPSAKQRATQSIGLLSYTFLRDTGHQDIVVPMVDYELNNGMICPLVRTNNADWAHNLKTITEWCPYHSEHDLFTQFFNMTERGTKVIIYNLWEDEEGHIELDFETDRFDIRVRRLEDPRNEAMAVTYQSCKHYLTYQHSLRSYAAILYHQHPQGFRIILRGQEVRHHDLEDDMMHIEHQGYKPQGFESSRDLKMSANIALGFVKDAKSHVNIQGYSVYHKNRLIKPFWKVWNTAGSDGRCIVGVLEANFVEPAHDKQSFERTPVLSRLELRLQQLQKNYCDEPCRSRNCHVVGYVNKKKEAESRTRKAAAASQIADVTHHGAQMLEDNYFGQQEPLQPRLSVPHGFPINTPPRADTASPVNDMNFHMVYRNRPSARPPGAPGFDLSFEVPADRSGPGTPEVTTPACKNFMWQGQESEARESPVDNRNQESLMNGFETMMRRGPADPAYIQGLLASVTGSGQPYDVEISRELDENKTLLAKLQKLEQTRGAADRSLNYEIERNRALEAKILDLEQKEAVDRRCLEQFIRERDNLQATLHEERVRHEHNDEEIRKNLKNAMLRARELEAENHRLRLFHHQN